MENKNSKMYVLYEMKGQYADVSKTLKEVVAHQKKLVQIVKDSKAENFQEFIAGVESDTKQKESAITAYNNRSVCADTIIKMYEAQDANSKLVDEVLTLAFDFLGVKSDAKKIVAPKPKEVK